MITLFDCTTAPSPRRARIVLHEKKIDYRNVQIDLRSREQLGPEFRAINPRCTVPVLELEDGTRLCDNAGIAAWAEAYQPEPALLGRTPSEKGLVAEWNARIEFDGLLAAMDVVRNTLPGMADRALTGPRNYAQIPELAERGKARIAGFFDDLNQRLEKREFIAIDDFSVADITALVVIDFIAWVKIKPGEQHDALRMWHGCVGARASAQA